MLSATSAAKAALAKRIRHNQHPIEPLFHMAGPDHHTGCIEAADRPEHRPPRCDQPVESPGRRLRRLAIWMVGIVEQLHFQATLPGVRQHFWDAREEATMAASGDTPLQSELEVLVLLACDEVNGAASATVREHAILAYPAARRKGVTVIAAPERRVSAQTRP